jgi:3-oxoacyl-[acyl-carrier protein] reductase
VKLGLDGKVAVVGGSTAGLGFAVAEALLREGAGVLVMSRSQSRVDAAVGRLREVAGDRVVGLAADLTDPTTPDRAVAAARDRFGPPTVIVANGGGPPAMAAVAAAAGDLEQACRLLLLPVQRLLEASLAGMRQAGWGRFVAITSVAVLEPQPGLVLSNALRAAVTGYLKSVADEVAGAGITVNSVCPGYTATDRLHDLAGAQAERDGTSPEAIFDGWARHAPIGRLLRPEEVAAAVVFLCSEQASGITGVSLAVDGGFHRGLL